TWLGNPEDVASTTPMLFLTRWVTHFCAPVFVFLAGTSAWLHGHRGAGRPTAELSRFLATRGLWLLLLEFTVVTFVVMHSLQVLLWQVIAAIGVAMLALAGLVWLPRWAIVAVGLLLVAGQDLYRELGASASGGWLDAWRLLHGGIQRPSPGIVQTEWVTVLPIYPVLPWIGVMALGYAAGDLLAGDERDRRRRWLTLGGALVALFVVVRLADVAGNTRSFWQLAEQGPTWIALLACEKYPPSLAYLLMTLGPAMFALWWFERAPGPLQRWLQMFGRVPLFFYVLHQAMVHAFAVLLFWLRDGRGTHLIQAELSFLGFEPLPAGFTGFGLWVAYAASAACVLLLWPLCRW
ncbi:MAG: DUF1624 domain-containing protein, partial [Planctomycetes bacterium]|nr:DUF1624 domain-containing protein [Planctomycetota bacterium]